MNDLIDILTPDEIAELCAIAHGADVSHYTRAMVLRGVHRKAPHIITISKAKASGSYLHATATAAGRAALAVVGFAA